MIHSPDRGEIAAAARQLGVIINDAELAAIADRMPGELAVSERFMNDHWPETTMPLRYPAREAGQRPSPDSDPLNCWLWRCDIGGGSGVLSGLRVGVKDHVAVAGMPLTFGSYAMRDLVADSDATVITRLLDAGATIVGKLNMDNFSSASSGLGGHGDGPRVANPHDRDRIAGGSSSGAAAAVAAAECDVAIAGDQAGSIRVPASWCGVYGLKPTFGLVPHTGIISASEATIDHVGPLARSIAELARCLQVISGPDGHDPRQHAIGESDFATVHAQLETGSDVELRGVRIGVLLEGFADDIDPEVDRLVRAAAATLRSAGATVLPLSIPTHLRIPDAYSALTVEGAAMLWETNWAGAGNDGFQPERLIAAIGRMRESDQEFLPVNMKLNYLVAHFRRRRFKGAVYARAHNVRKYFRETYDAALRTCDAILMPTACMTAPPYVQPTTNSAALEQTLFGGRTGAQLIGMGRNTLPFNYTGHPALSVPCGHSRADGMPVGFQLVGAHLSDATLVGIAAAYESVAAS